MGQVSDAIAPLTAKLNIIAFFEVFLKNNSGGKMIPNPVGNSQFSGLARVGLY